MSTIPYTHWAHFKDRADADECATALNELGLLVRIDRSKSESSEPWLRASCDVDSRRRSTNGCRR